MPPEGVPSLSRQECAVFFIILNAIRMYTNLLVYVVIVYLPLLEYKLLDNWVWVYPIILLMSRIHSTEKALYFCPPAWFREEENKTTWIRVVSPWVKSSSLKGSQLFFETKWMGKIILGLRLNNTL